MVAADLMRKLIYCEETDGKWHHHYPAGEFWVCVCVCELLVFDVKTFKPFLNSCVGF